MQADKKSVLHKLKIARGQIDAIIKMVEEDAYCIDLSNQIIASVGLLKSTNQEILEAHIRSCVSQALDYSEANPGEGQAKVEEALKTLEKMLQSKY